MTSASSRTLRLLPRRIYPFRILGMALGGVAMSAVLFELDAPPATWAFLLLTAVVWPHLAYRIALRSTDPYRAEARNLMIDSAIAGAWVPLMHFNLLPSTLIVTLTTVDKISTGMRGLWLRSLSGLVGAGLGTALLTGFAFAPDTSMPVLLACLPLLLIHTISVSLGSYRLIRKVSEQNVLLDQLHRTDSLTGLSGRGDWEQQAEALLSDLTAGGGTASLLLIDIDRFKQVNDRHGHGAGDEVLRAIAAQLRQAMRPQDIAGRLGGDEFAVLLPDTPAGEARQVAERLRGAVERLCLRDFPDVHPTISVGLAATDDGAHAELRAWLDAADSALYRAKDQGRNRVVG